MKRFTILICGGRDYDDVQTLFGQMDAFVEYEPDETGCLSARWYRNLKRIRIIHGDARGADTIAHVWAKYRGLEVQPYPARWKEYGKEAGPLRNQEMLDSEDVDVVVAFPGGTGTADMVRRAKRDKIRVCLF